MTRIQTIPVHTQDYTSAEYGDDRIAAYITEPAQGVHSTTGFMLLIHGWGNDGAVAYESDSITYADEFDLVVTRVEFRHSGREARAGQPAGRWDVPYDFSKLQTIDCLRAAYATLQRYPQLDRSRLLLWGGSQGAHLCAQCLVFAPHLWALAVLNCGLYLPLTGAQADADGFAYDIRDQPGIGFVEVALGEGRSFSPAEEDIRNPVRNAELMPSDVPIVIIHGTHDATVDIRHSVILYARLLGLQRPVQFYAIENGDHGLALATFKDTDSRLKATFKYVGETFRSARRDGVALQPAVPVRIPVRGGVFAVEYSAIGPTLHWHEESPATA
jgi:predicted esterase